MVYRRTEKMIERREARRRRILDSAIALFGRLGYHAATVPMIVSESQSSTGAFYLYFRNKEDVYVAALGEIGERLSAAINGAIAGEVRANARMETAVRVFVQWLAENRSEARILTEAAVLGGRMEEARRSIIESHVRSVASALQQLDARFEARERAIIARCWVGSVLEASQAWVGMASRGRVKPEILGAIVARFNLRGAGLTPANTNR